MENRLNAVLGCLTLLLTLFHSYEVQADQNTPAPPLSWAECSKRVKQYNPEYLAALKKLEASQELAKASLTGFLPTLSASSSASTTSLKNTQNSTTQYSSQLTLNQNLFNGLSDTAKFKKAKSELLIAEATFQAARAKLSANLFTAYENLLFANDSIQLANSIVLRREENLRLVELRFDSGRENKGSVLLSKAYLKDSKYAALRAKNTLTLARQQLARIIATPEEDVLTIDRTIPILSNTKDTPDFTLLARLTPAAKIAQEQLASAETDITSSRSDFLPKLNFSAETGKAGTTLWPNENSWQAGITLSIPLFNGFQSTYTLKNSHLLFESTEKSTLNIEKEQLMQIRQAWNTLIETIEKEEVDKSYEDAAKLRAEIARSKYNNGLLSFDAWDVIETDLINRQTAFLSTQQNRVSADASWQQTLGKDELQ